MASTDVGGMAMRVQCKMSTGTATVAVFDPACLEHRLEDTADWWSDEDEELQEINAGNVLFASTHVDGGYAITVDGSAAAESDGGVRALLRCASGRFFVGAGEQVPGDGVLPDTNYGGGTYVEVGAGSYVVVVRHRVPGELEVSIARTDGEARNAFTTSPELPWPKGGE